MLEGVSIFESAVMLTSGVLRLGPMRVSVYGLWSAVGLIAALWLSQRTAKRVGLAGEQLWDAGWFAVTSLKTVVYCFVLLTCSTQVQIRMLS